MGFEKFEGGGRGRPAGADPTVSLRRSGSIGVNQPVLDEYFADAEGAVLYYDADENRVGIEPVSDADSDDAAYTVSRSETGATIAATAFLERYDLAPAVTTQYAPEWDDDAGMVAIDLDDPLGTYGSADDAADEDD